MITKVGKSNRILIDLRKEEILSFRPRNVEQIQTEYTFLVYFRVTTFPFFFLNEGEDKDFDL